MSSTNSLRSLVPTRSAKEKNMQLAFGLDRTQKIISVSENNPFEQQGQTVLLGKSLEQVAALRHFHALLAGGFCFKFLPVPIDDRWYAAGYLPGGGDGAKAGGELVLDVLDRGSEAAMVLHDFVQSIDPFSLEADGGVLLVDRAGLILMVNREFADILGLQASEMVGLHVNESYPDSTLSRLPKVMESGKAEIENFHLTSRCDEDVLRFYVPMKNSSAVGRP